MPTYEYLCAKCGHDFDVVQSMTKSALTVCPKDVCPKKPWAKGKVKRVIGAGAGLIFKGSGFYITDYRSDKYKESAKKDSNAGTSSETKKESKPAATPSTPAPASTPAKKEK